MKKMILSVLMLTLATLCVAQTKSINKFYRKYKFEEEVTKFTLPGWLIRFGLSVSGEKKNLDEVELKLLKSLKKFRLLVKEGGPEIKKEDYMAMKEGLRNESFEEYLAFREEGTDVKLYVREKKETFKNLLFLINDDEEFVMISLKTKIDKETFDSLQDEITTEMLKEFR